VIGFQVMEVITPVINLMGGMMQEQQDAHFPVHLFVIHMTLITIMSLISLMLLQDWNI